MSGIAEVLAAHHHNEGIDLDRNIYSWCMCEGLDGWRAYDYHDAGRGAYAEHVDAALTAAGFGPVKEAAAKALEDAADGWSDWDALEAPEDWLRARAAAVRGEG